MNIFTIMSFIALSMGSTVSYYILWICSLHFDRTIGYDTCWLWYDDFYINKWHCCKSCRCCVMSMKNGTTSMNVQTTFKLSRLITYTLSNFGTFSDEFFIIDQLTIYFFSSIGYSRVTWNRGIKFARVEGIQRHYTHL